MSVTRRQVTGFTRIIRIKRQHLLSAAAAVIAAAALYMSIALYVKANTVDYYEVIREGKTAGTVSDPAVIGRLVQRREAELAEKNPGLSLHVDTGKLSFRPASAFRAKPGSEEDAARMIESWGVYATGSVIRVAGKPVAIAKDEAAAKLAIAKVRAKYAPAGTGSAGAPQANATPAARTLSAKTAQARASQPPAVMKEAYILEEVSTATMRIDPERVADADTLVDRLAGVLTVKTVEQSVVTAAIEPQKVVRNNPELKAGKTLVVSPGAKGEKRVTYRTVKRNGTLVSKEPIGVEIVKPASPMIVVKGTKVMKGVADGNFAWPVAGARITSTYGKRWGRLHKGIDLVGSSSILAADGGVVEFAGRRNGLGKAVIINHRNGYKTVYAHLSRISVKEGDLLEKGQKLGVMGNTGHSFGVHLHFEIYKDGKVQNPKKYL